MCIIVYTYEDIYLEIICMDIYVYMYIYISIHICIDGYTYIHTYTYVYMYINRVGILLSSFSWEQR